MDFIILTGVSGAGKSKAVAALEDIGFFCVDNIPPSLIEKFAEQCLESDMKTTGIAVVVDARSKEMFHSFSDSLQAIQNKKIQYKVVFMDADDAVLLNRFKETRRKHPLLDESNTLEEAIVLERELLHTARQMADYIIDTSNLPAAKLKEKIYGFFANPEMDSITVNCVSFGFKHGTPHDVDLQFDVRCLPNPFYIDNLKERTGLEEVVVEYIMSFEESKGFLNKIFDLLQFVMPLYVAEGKSQLTIGVGCTGGKHRSVAFAESINKYLNTEGYKAVVTHRDILK